jgi:hypothetical protein
MMRSRVCRGVLGLLLVPIAAWAGGFTLGPRAELTHPGIGPAGQLSAAAIAVGRDGRVFIAWAAQEGPLTQLYLIPVGVKGVMPVRVNAAELTVAAVHHAPGLDIGPRGEIYVSWSSSRPEPADVPLASDLRLSRSLDGGRSFDSHLRVDEERPIAPGLEGLSVAEDGAVLVAWVDSRDGGERAAAFVARIGERGTRVELVRRLDGDACACCRVDVATGPHDAVAVVWRKVFPEGFGEMALALSRDGGRSFGRPQRVHADGWRLAACPQRGGSVDMDGAGRLYLAWYTEDAQAQPRLLWSVAADGRRFAPPLRLDDATASRPDHVRLAVNAEGQAVIVWEDATAVRRRVLMRYTLDGGRTLSPIQVLSQALTAYAPSVTVSPRGDFVAVWHEAQPPDIKTVVQPIRLAGGR